jgi:hypothetical protein
MNRLMIAASAAALFAASSLSALAAEVTGAITAVDPAAGIVALDDGNTDLLPADFDIASLTAVHLHAAAVRRWCWTLASGRDSTREYSESAPPIDDFDLHDWLRRHQYFGLSGDARRRSDWDPGGCSSLAALTEARILKGDAERSSG